MTESSIELHFVSDPENLAPVRACVERFAGNAGFDEEKRAQIALAVDEAIANSIRHGYRGRRDGPITLRLAALPTGGVRIELDDEGEQVDIERIEPRDLCEVRPGGLGLHIIRSTFDHCDWRRRPERGMSVVLELPLPGAKLAHAVRRPRSR
ncbi:MAG: ATP-binding protein [Phycisphaerae bacterium]|nr:ATP-binding protein [Phycisphaerae bacterium]